MECKQTAQNTQQFGQHLWKEKQLVNSSDLRYFLWDFIKDLTEVCVDFINNIPFINNFVNSLKMLVKLGRWDLFLAKTY